MDRGGLTKAGRALDKHGNRPGSAFPKATGSPASKNAQGQHHLDDILTDPKGCVKPNKYGGHDYYRSDGTGARYYEDGSFIMKMEVLEDFWSLIYERNRF